MSGTNAASDDHTVAAVTSSIDPIVCIVAGVSPEAFPALETVRLAPQGKTLSWARSR